VAAALVVAVAIVAGMAGPANASVAPDSVPTTRPTVKASESALAATVRRLGQVRVEQVEIATRIGELEWALKAAQATELATSFVALEAQFDAQEARNDLATIVVDAWYVNAGTSKLPDNDVSGAAQQRERYTALSIERATATRTTARTTAEAVMVQLNEVRIQIEVAKQDLETAKTSLADAKAGEQELMRQLSAYMGAPVGELGIPRAVIEAYVNAAAVMEKKRPTCGLQWWLLAGVGAIESGHGTSAGATVLDNGVVAPYIIGPTLDGSGGFKRILDSEDGVFDGDDVFDHAVGPMQFLPGTWRTNGLDGDGDGFADPHNIWDATLSAASYLCKAVPNGGLDSSTEAQLAALWSYNRSEPYGQTALATATAYEAIGLPSLRVKLRPATP
jgi:membrane-bound lytic murein transglycosylase B